MKPTFILLLTAIILATTVPLYAQGESPSPAATAASVVFEPLPTLNASVILQPQYFQGPNFTVRNPVPTSILIRVIAIRGGSSSRMYVSV
jgi:hypothetical protein